jgi:predicted RNase H-like HicB family nuclease
MEKLIIQIGASSNHFGGLAVNVDGVYGAGNTVEECKANISEGIELLIKHSEKNHSKVPKWLVDNEYEIEYRYDLGSQNNQSHD